VVGCNVQRRLPNGVACRKRDLVLVDQPHQVFQVPRRRRLAR
jgi:hypothetical protein